MVELSELHCSFPRAQAPLASSASWPLSRANSVQLPFQESWGPAQLVFPVVMGQGAPAFAPPGRTAALPDQGLQGQGLLPLPMAGQVAYGWDGQLSTYVLLPYQVPTTFSILQSPALLGVRIFLSGPAFWAGGWICSSCTLDEPDLQSRIWSCTPISNAGGAHAWFWKQAHVLPRPSHLILVFLILFCVFYVLFVISRGRLRSHHWLLHLCHASCPRWGSLRCLLVWLLRNQHCPAVQVHPPSPPGLRSEIAVCASRMVIFTSSW